MSADSKSTNSQKTRHEQKSPPQAGALDDKQLDKVAGGTIEVSDYGFGVAMPVATSRSDGGGATVSSTSKK